MGAKAVDAVEIDPAIIAIGEAAHPERPYQHPGVRTIVNDARSFFRTTTGKYDMVVYGLLDSHSVLKSRGQCASGLLRIYRGGLP